MNTTTSKTISFEKIKAKALQACMNRLSGNHLLGWWLPTGEGQGRVFAADMAHELLLPATVAAMKNATPGAGGLSGVEVEAGKMAVELEDRCRKIIEHWDVRAVNRLVDLFPDAVPASCRLRNASCAVVDTPDGQDSEWVVTFDLTSRRQPTKFTGEEAALNFVAGPGGRLKELLPRIEAAQREYDATWEAALQQPGATTMKLVAEATARFNQVLELAARAFWLDTREYNHWPTIQQVYAPKADEPTSLWFSSGGHENGKVAQMLANMARDLESGRLEQILREQHREMSDAGRGHQDPATARQRG